MGAVPPKAERFAQISSWWVPGLREGGLGAQRGDLGRQGVGLARQVMA
ncbi:hypothetical protein [Streptomyces fagopyri]